MRYWLLIAIIAVVSNALQNDKYFIMSTNMNEFQSINSTFKIRNADAGLDRKLLELVFNIHRLILSIYNIFTNAEVTVKATQVRESTSISDITLNGTRWEYVWSSQSTCATYDNSVIDENAETILDYCVDKSLYNITLAICLIVDLPDTCSYKLRLQRKTDVALKIQKPFQNIWDIQCTSMGSRHIKYTGGLCYRTSKN